jgi:hypothetical protein
MVSSDRQGTFAVAEALVACRRPCGMGTTAYRSRGEHDYPASYLNYTGSRLQDVTAPMAFRQLRWGFGSWKLASHADEATLILEALEDIRLVFWLKIGRGDKVQVATLEFVVISGKRIRSAQPERTH